MKQVRYHVSIFLLFLFPLAGMVIESGAESAMDTSKLEFPSDFDSAPFQERLHPEHPRLFATGQEWERIRNSVETSPHLQNVIRALEKVAVRIGEAQPEEREMTGRRLLAVSREVLRRTLVLGVLYQVSGEERYFDRARMELLAAAAFEDWNPSHFLDTAEMTLALAVGYDWFYHRFSEEERETLRAAILEKGLEAGRGAHRWKERDNNWNQVCFAGMVAGALAIGDHEPGIAVEFLHETFADIHRPLDAYRPDGAYPEGPTYWSYGTHFQVILLSVLESALGKTWNLENYPAFRESAVYINLMVGPSGKFYNYADGRARVSPLPALHWFAVRAGNPLIDARERERIADASEDLAAFADGIEGERFFPLTILWFDPGLEEKETSPLPLHWQADGSNPVAVHRSSRDRDSLYLGIKGGSPSVNHGHMDIGSFVLDWRGLRWAVDLGMQDYESLESLGMSIWNRSQEGDRWRVFRMNTHSHNTLVVDNGHQKVDGFAPITAFSDDPDGTFTVVDMTGVYEEELESALRGARLLGEEAVLIHDEVKGLDTGQRLRWGMVTPAGVDIEGSRAVLRQEGETLYARIVSPETATFAIEPTDPPPNEFDARNPETRMLAFAVEGDGEPQQLRVVLSAEPLSEEEIKRIRSQSAPGEWLPADGS